jgi:MinD-like ATPase involved in chromosome partitioning or flagellar assembly
MIVTCWSAKGGVGTTVVVASLALSLVRRHPAGVLAVDLAGDLPAALGLAEPAGPGVVDWLASTDDAHEDTWRHLETPEVDGLRVLPRGGDRVGEGGGAGERVDHLVDALALDPRAVVVDAGRVEGGHGPGAAFAAGSTVSLLVTRGCYLALRRCTDLPLRPSGVVLVAEPGRALDAEDVEAVVGVPVVARVVWDPAVARAVDAGLLAARLPRRLERALRSAA